MTLPATAKRQMASIVAVSGALIGVDVDKKQCKAAIHFDTRADAEEMVATFAVRQAFVAEDGKSEYARPLCDFMYDDRCATQPARRGPDDPTPTQPPSRARR